MHPIQTTLNKVIALAAFAAHQHGELPAMTEQEAKEFKAPVWVQNALVLAQMTGAFQAAEGSAPAPDLEAIIEASMAIAAGEDLYAHMDAIDADPMAALMDMIDNWRA